jgi:hypothetical protein
MNTDRASEPGRTTLTQAAYARHRKAHGLPGGTKQAVSRAIAAGRISTTMGRLDPAVADQEWLRNTRAWGTNREHGKSRPTTDQPAGHGRGAAWRRLLAKVLLCMARPFRPR